MMKKIVSLLLVLTLLLGAFPVNAFARKVPAVYGDANADGKVDLNDVLSMRKTIAEELLDGFNTKNADVNGDGKVNLTDLLLLKKFLAEWDIQLGPDELPIHFYDGDRLIETLYADKGAPLGQTPNVKKTSKATGIFEGWYLDPEFTQPFYAEEPVTQETNVYAKYDRVAGLEETLTIDSFATTEVSPTHKLIIKGTGDAQAAVQLLAKDGTVAPDITVTDLGDGTFEITAPEGFREGSSYELKLAEGFNFVGENGELPATVRTAAFTVEKEIVDNMKLNEDIRYIADTASITYKNVDGNADGAYTDTVDVLDPKTGINPQGSLATVTGAAVEGLAAGDIVCFYVGTNPKDRVYTGENATAYVGQPEIYVKVVTVTGDGLTFAALAQDEVSDVYDIPDVFPLKGTAADNQISLSTLDLGTYALYGLETPTLAYAQERINLGDFVAVYTEATADGAGTTVGRITAYNAATGEITFAPCDIDDIISARDVYVQPAISGDDLVDEESRQEIEDIMLSQIQESGFAEEAAYTLANLSTKTDGFRNMENLRTVLLNGETGEPLTDEEIELLSIGASFELAEGVELSVELITEGDELHFKDGLQLAVGIEAQFKVEAEDGNVVIDLNATFIEELEVKPTVDGELTYKKVLGIPIPNGVRVGAIVDVKNYTAYDFDVTAYTVPEEEQSTWDKLKEIAKNPTKITDVVKESGLVPEKYADKLETIGDIFQTIEDVEKAIMDAQTKYKETKEEIEGHQEDLETLWEVVDTLHQQGYEGELFTKETWAEAGMALSKTNIAQELLHLTEDGITDGDAGVDNDVSIQSVEELMERYAEMLQKETDWVTLLDQKITEANAQCYVVNFMLKVDFIIRANMSIALGSTLEYEMGKRYNFWFRVGLYKPTSGSTTMDLIDESLAFQFYVMGKLEIKMGAKITLGVSLGSADVAYVGIYTELGPYVKLYGFFVYTYQRLREANTLTNIKKEQKMGALYLETGIYLIVGVEASAIMGLFETSYDFMDEEFPILTAGSEEYPYGFSYELMEDEKILVRDSDGNSANGVTGTVPEELRAVKTMILTSGLTVDKVFDYKDYNISLSNPNFSLDKETGIITVKVPDGVRSMDCEMRLTFKHGKMAFSDYDIGITIPLFWTNLSTAELNEYYTASVRVGNDSEGYQTVWTKRMRKNTAFQLPTAEEVKALVGYNDLKYVSGGYAAEYDTSAGLIENKVYDFVVESKYYSVNVETLDGVKTFTARLGEAFDFSALNGTGVNDRASGTYTVFQNVTTAATVVVGKDADGSDVVEPLNLTSPISQRMAEALSKGVTAKANYVDNSATATFTFSGLIHGDVEQTLAKGETPELTAIEKIAADNGLAVKDIAPALESIHANTTYTVTLGELTGEKFTLSFDEQGGNEVADITKVGGSLLGALPVPTKAGHQFLGWHTADGKLFESKLMPKENTTLTAKWEAGNITVSFHINGGTGDTPAAIAPIYGSAYGELPRAEKTGYGFIGWFTAAEGGTQITAQTKVETTENLTLYAQWRELKAIPREIFSFTKPENPTYEKNTEIDMSANVTYSGTDTGYDVSQFKVEYILDGGGEDYVAKPRNAGTYIAKVSRPADDYYAKFEEVYSDVLTVNKATRVVPEGGYQIALQGQTGYTMFTVGLVGASVDDLSPYATLNYYLVNTDKSSSTGFFDNLLPGGNDYIVQINITGDPNYEDVVSAPTYMMDGETKLNGVPTKTLPTESWADHTEQIDYSGDVVKISTPGQLAMVAKIIDNGGALFDGYKSPLAGKTIQLENDIDLSGYLWKPIGNRVRIPELLIYLAQTLDGTLDGQGHTITGMVVNTGTARAGLFGIASEKTVIQNVVLDDSYVNGGDSTGSFVGDMAFSVDLETVEGRKNLQIINCVSHAVVIGKEDVGGIAGYTSNAQITNCVNYGWVKASGPNLGGIVGYQEKGTTYGCQNYGYVNSVSGSEDCDVGGIVGNLVEGGTVTSCVNYGSVRGNNNHVGGIVGYNENSKVLNSANHGSVYGHKCVAGIAGQNDKGEVYNNYATGSITSGTGNYIGAIVGRNTDNKGSVDQGYYLKGSCPNRNALGTKNGSLDDGEKNKCASFQKPANDVLANATLSRGCEDGGSNVLIEDLQHWVTRVNNDDSKNHLPWIVGSDGCPTFNYTGIPTSALRK